MKVNNKIRRITSVCAAAVLVFMIFLMPLSVSAEKVTDFNLSLLYRIQQNPEGIISMQVADDIENKSTYHVGHEPVTDIPMDYLTKLQFSANIFNSTKTTIIKAGETFEVSISGLYLDVGVSNSGFVWKQTPSTMYIQIYYPDGTFTRINDLTWSYNTQTSTHSITCTGVAQKDIIRMYFFEEIEQYAVTRMHGSYPVSIGMGDLENPTYMQVDIESKEAGLLGDLNNQLGEAINGTPEQNQQAQDAVGGLNNSADKLDDLGDQMASVEKPSFDNSNISADSLVPDTSLVVLASPFQALWENNQLLAMLTIVVTVVLISWVFFGKKA